MSSIYEQFGVKEVADITFFELDSYGRQKPVLYIDTAKVSTVEKSASNAEARGGKGNPALISWDFGVEINVTLEDALFSPKSMALMQGSGKVRTGTPSKPVAVDVANEMATVSDAGTFILKHTPIANTLYIYVIDNNGRWVNGEQLHNAKIAGRTVTLDTPDIATLKNKDIVCFYKTNIMTDAAQVINISADTFGGTYRVVGDTFARSRATGKDEYFQLIIHRAKLASDTTFTFQADGDPSTFNMSLRVLRNVADPRMIDLIKYNFDMTDTEEAEDMNSSDNPHGVKAYTTLRANIAAAAGALATANLTMAMADDKVAAGASNAAQITAKLSAMRNASTGSYTLFVKAYDEAVAINAKIGATADEINQSASGLASATQALNTDVGQLAALVNA